MHHFHRVVSLQGGSSNKQLRFETLLNKLMDQVYLNDHNMQIMNFQQSSSYCLQNAVKNKWAILYLLNELSEDNGTADISYRSRSRIPSAAHNDVCI